MIYCLDTNIVVQILRGKGEEGVEKLRRLVPEQVKIPSVVRAELLLGAMKSARPTFHRDRVEQFLEPFEELAFAGEACEIYAKTRAALEKKGAMIGPNDLLIAATVIANKGTLVTGNVKEFERVKSLKIVDWLK